MGGGLKGRAEAKFHPIEGTFKEVGLLKACLDLKDLAKASKVDAARIISLLKGCANNWDLATGSRLHAYIQEHNFLEKNSFIANTLVSMYARCGALAQAQQVLDGLPVRDAVTWNALMAGYAQHGQGEETLRCFYKMQQDGHIPDAFTFSCALKACGSIGAAVEGKMIHDKIVSLGMLEKNNVLGNAVVNMYAKCGDLSMAQQVLEGLPVRNVVTWTTLLARYVHQGKKDEALKCFKSMQCDGHTPDAFAFACALKACGSTGALAEGQQIHDKVVRSGMLETNVALGSALVDMYARCGALAKAQCVLEELPVRDVGAWNALIAGYTQQGRWEELLKWFDRMQIDGHSPSMITFVSALKACGSTGAVAKGKQIHDKIVSLGMLEKDIGVGNTLVNMYARCGALDNAHQVLEELPVRDVVTWNALIAGYAQRGEGETALKCFNSMQRDGHSPNVFTFIYALKACGSIGAAVEGNQIHGKIASLGMMEKNIVLGNALVHMYARCGALIKAWQVLEELPVRGMVSWTVLVGGYIERGQGEEALKCFDNMQYDGHTPDTLTVTCALKACGIIGATAKGKEIHDKIVSLGMLEKNFVLGSALVDMYAKCGALARAQQVLEELPMREVVAWTTLMAGYVQQGQGEKALMCFDSMQWEGHTPDVITFMCALNACGSIGAAVVGEQIHSRILSLNMLEKSIVLGNALVDMYSRCGELAKARQLLEGFPVRDVVSWTTLIARYAQQGQGEEALKCFDGMQSDGHSPDAFTFLCSLKACGSIGATAKGQHIHDKIISLGMLEKNFLLGNMLVGMYARCGVLSKAHQVLEELAVRDIITWTALIGGYAQQEQGEEALKCFARMQQEGHTPDSVTFCCVLNVCSHSGLSQRAEIFFSAMSTKHGIIPELEHYCCMVDLFGREGKFNKALDVIKEMQPAELLCAWIALLGACCRWGEVKIGKFAFVHVVHLNEQKSS